MRNKQNVYDGEYKGIKRLLQMLLFLEKKGKKLRKEIKKIKIPNKFDEFDIFEILHIHLIDPKIPFREIIKQRKEYNKYIQFLKKIEEEPRESFYIYLINNKFKGEK